MVQAIQVLRFHLLELEKVSVNRLSSERDLNARIINQKKNLSNRRQKSIVSSEYGDGMRYLNYSATRHTQQSENLKFK